MSLLITQYPKRVIDSEALQVSRWQAIWNNLIYKIYRKDFIVNSVAGDGSSPEVAVLTVASTLPTVEEGGTVYVNAGAYVGNFTVLSANSNTITIDTPYIATASGYVNLLTTRSNYYVVFEVLQKNGSDYEVWAEDKRVADSTGLITLDIASYVRSILNMENESEYDARTYPDPNMSAIVNITMQEFWDSYEGGVSEVDEEEDYYIVNSAMQKLNPYGSNQGEWVPFPPNLVSPLIEQHKGKFLSDFEKPTYWEGYPFDLSFIYPKDFEDNEVRTSIVEELYNINRSQQSSDDDIIDEDTNNVVRAMLNGGYGSTIKTVDVYLKAKAISGLVDPSPISWGPMGLTGSGKLQLIYNGQTYGNANFNTDMDTTFADLVISVNTATQNGSLLNGSYPFISSSVGLIASYNSATDTFTLAVPPGSGATWNVSFFMAVDGNWSFPGGLQSKTFTGGSNGSFADLLGLTTAKVTEVKTIKIGDVCSNPVYLCWHNKYGGKSYWLFQGIQQESVTTKVDSMINRYTEDVSEQITDQDIIAISSGKDIVVGADNLLTEDILGLVGLKQSARVMMLVDVDNLVWQTVIIKPGTMQLPDTDAEMGDVRFTLQLADDNLPGQ